MFPLHEDHNHKYDEELQRSKDARSESVIKGIEKLRDADHG